MFNTANSARATVNGSAKWKSRKLDLGNRHRTTLNFGDLVPAYWQHVQPGDKLRLDCSILAKFMPLIAPAFSRMKIKSEWFYVPLRQIAEPTLRALQDFKPDPSEMSEYYAKLLSNGFADYSPTTPLSENQQIHTLSGFLTIPAHWINSWLVGDCATVVRHNTDYKVLGSSWTSNSWRAPVDSNVVFTNLEYTLGQENVVSFTSKYRCAKLLSYMGLPSRLTTMRYNDDYIFDYNDVTASAHWPLIDKGSVFTERYSSLVFGDENLDTDDKIFPAAGQQYKNALAYSLVNDATFNTVDNSVIIPPVNDYWTGLVPCNTTYSAAAISAIPFQAYQKIFNDFYRDEKLQTTEIRYFPSYVFDGMSFVDAFGALPIITSENPHFFLFHNVLESGNPAFEYSPYTVFFNNLFGLRRRNRSKDVISSCVTDQVVRGQLDVASSETVYDAKLQSRIARYFMKKEFTGSTWAEWLNNFFDVNSNDLLNKNVIFLGGRDSVVSISENIQNSESTDASAQGNRAGLANDFHNGGEIYFRVPDFGVIMCIVSVIPDDIDNFNGLQERFQKSSVFDFNLPDFQNIGYAPMFNRRVNIGFADSAVNESLPSYPSALGHRSHADASSVFGFQPFGYQHTYTPNVISGDFQNSLRFWHQSPDLDFDFSDGSYTSWWQGQPQLNFNLPSIGLRFQPYGADLKAQYYNNVFAQTNDESGDHIVADMRFSVTCHRNTAFFTDALDS